MRRTMHAEPVLILFATREGHTARIADRIATLLASRDIPSVVEDISAHPSAPDPRRHAAIVLAGSVHFGRHARALSTYVVTNRAALQASLTMLVSVSMNEAIAHYTKATAVQRAAARVRSHVAVDAFCAQTRFRPKHIQLIGGGLPYTKLGFFKRQLVRLMAAQQGGPTDPSRDHDLTVWSVLDSVADTLARAIRPEVQRTVLFAT